MFRRGRAHVSVSRDKFGCGRRFLHFGVAVHVGFLAFERRSGLLDPLIGFAPAPPGDREAAVLQGRAERAGAPRQPLAARSALAVAILFSFAHQAKVRRRWREQETGGVEGVGAAVIRGNDKATM